MGLYQLYRLNTGGKTSGDALEVECDDDETARAVGRVQGGEHEALEIWNGRRLVGRAVPQTSATTPKLSCGPDVPIAQVKLIVSRASVLTLWASVVAERLGHQRMTALTLAKAVAGTSARLKVRVIGREEWVASPEMGAALGLDLPRLHKKPAMAHVILLGKTIPLLTDASGQLRAALRTLPTRDGGVANEYVAADPAEVERYLIKTFGPHLTNVRTAMEVLVACCEPLELNRIGFQLYEKFQPGGPYGREGRRGKAALEIENILAALPHVVNHDNNFPGLDLDTPLPRSFARIAKPFSIPRSAYEPDQVMVEHCQNVRRIKETVAKVRHYGATATRPTDY
jgi:hypothetical protein